MKRYVPGMSVALALVLVYSSKASEKTVGPNGINSAATGLDGFGAFIGQVEPGRPGKPGYDTDPDCCNEDINPFEVFTRSTEADPNEALSEHALWVASVMISNQDTIGMPGGVSPPIGVAPAAILSSSAYLEDQMLVNIHEDAALAVQAVAPTSLATNMSFSIPDQGFQLDGNSTLTSFVDWSTKRHSVLYVVGGPQINSDAIPSDNFNGITVASSARVDGVFRRVSGANVFNDNVDAVGPRTSTHILAPGELVDVAGPNGSQPFRTDSTGTSMAAPHVTGTHALLQQQATTANGLRHETMKAVILNSADKTKGIIGMERTVLKQNGTSTWFGTDAHSDPAIPVDREMGVGHLNAKRAVEQHAGGEHPGGGALIGWDYAIQNDPFIPNKYTLSMNAGDFVSATLVWDRDVFLNSPFLDYQRNDEFLDFGFADLNLYLVPAGQAVDQAVASSTSTAWNLEHIFNSVATGGNYELWVTTSEMNEIPYAIAWWAGPDQRAALGDYDLDGDVDAQDYTNWRAGFGNSVIAGTAADGNGNGVIDAADYVVWRDNLSAGAGSSAAVPEPASAMLLLVAAVATCARRRGAA